MIFGLKGYAGTGKDTVANILIEKYGFYRVAFADAVRDAALALDPWVLTWDLWDLSAYRLSEIVEVEGWDGAKRNHDEVRRILQAIGTDMGRAILGDDVWIEIAARKILAAFDHSDFVITDARFQNECDFIRGGGGVIVGIDRPGFGPINNHVSDAGLNTITVDYTLNNNGSIEDLERKVDNLVAAYREMP